jgi:hypothetical protein
MVNNLGSLLSQKKKMGHAETLMGRLKLFALAAVSLTPRKKPFR